MNQPNPLTNTSGTTVAAHSVARRRGVMASVRSDASASDNLSARRSGVVDAIWASTACARSGQAEPRAEVWVKAPGPVRGLGQVAQRPDQGDPPAVGTAGADDRAGAVYEHFARY